MTRRKKYYWKLIINMVNWNSKLICGVSSSLLLWIESIINNHSKTKTCLHVSCFITSLKFQKTTIHLRCDSETVFRRCSVEKVFLEHLCQSLFFNKVAGWKKDSDTGVFLWILQNFQEHLFLQHTSGAYFWWFNTSYIRNETMEPEVVIQRCFIQKQLQKVFYKNSVLKNFAKLTGKHLCQRFFFNKVTSLS